MAWWTRVKRYWLKKLYRLLVIRTQILSKVNLYHYHRYPTFATIKIPTNKGDFTFIFKEDRRKRVRGTEDGKWKLSSYFVELVAPPHLANPSNPLHDKVIVVVKVTVAGVNYEALGELLLDLYLGYF